MLRVLPAILPVPLPLAKRIIIVQLRDWFVEPLAKAGDYRKDQIIGEFGFVVVNESAHALIIDTATS